MLRRPVVQTELESKRGGDVVVCLYSDGWMLVGESQHTSGAKSESWILRLQKDVLGVVRFVFRIEERNDFVQRRGRNELARSNGTAGEYIRPNRTVVKLRRNVRFGLDGHGLASTVFVASTFGGRVSDVSPDYAGKNELGGLRITGGHDGEQESAGQKEPSEAMPWTKAGGSRLLQDEEGAGESESRESEAKCRHR
jgi:hypothetical protein